MQVITKIKTNKYINTNTNTNTTNSAAIGYAKICLSQIFSKLPNSIHLLCAPEFDNTLCDILSLIHLELDEEENTPSYHSSIVSHLRNKFHSVASQESSKRSLMSMLDFSFNYMKSCPITELVTPDIKALVKVVESAHPYTDNMDQIWEVRIPGVKKLRITFDEKSATETDNDYLYIFDIDRVKKLYKHKIHGRNSGESHWPGVGICPPVLIQGDSCVLHMITDAGVVDWGFKATIHGILEEPSEEEIAVYTKDREDRKRSMKYINVVCWVLTILMISEDAEIQEKLYSAETGTLALVLS